MIIINKREKENMGVSVWYKVILASEWKKKVRDCFGGATHFYIKKRYIFYVAMVQCQYW